MTSLGDTNTDIRLKQQVQSRNNNAGSISTPNNTGSNITSLFNGILRFQAEKAGLLSLFEQYNTNVKDDKIDDKEFANYKHSLHGRRMINQSTEQVSEQEVADLRKINPRNKVEKAKRAMSMIARELGISDRIAHISELYNSGEKKDIDTLLKEKLGEEEYSKIANLSKEEKFVILKDYVVDKYNTNYTSEELANLPDNNPMKQNYERLKRGELTTAERNQGLTEEMLSELSDDQLLEYAKKAVVLDQMVEMAEMFATADGESLKMLAGTIGDMPPEAQVGLISAAIVSAPDDATRVETTKMILSAIKDGTINLAEESREKIVEIASTLMAENSEIKDLLDAITSENANISAENQIIAYQTADSVEREKVERGEITQEQYDSNYVEVYANSAYKLKDAAQAYQIVQDRSSDSNRRGALGKLASNAYMIKDESQRNSAISGLRNSQYYSKYGADIEVNLAAGYAAYVGDVANGVNSSSGGAVSNSMNEPYVQSKSYQEAYNGTSWSTEESKKVSESIISIIRSDNREVKDKTYLDTIDKLSDDNLNNKNQKYRQMQFSQAVLVLNEAIQNGDFDNSEYKNKMLKKISSIDNNTLINNVLLRLGPKAQEYLIKEGVVSIETLDIVIKLEHDLQKLPQSVQDAIRERREERERPAIRPFD